jgi:hypothetical protein
LKDYEPTLRSKAIVIGPGQHAQGYRLRYVSDVEAELTYDGRKVGHIAWWHGFVRFSPQIYRLNPAHTAHDDFDQWMSRAYEQSLMSPKL